MEPITNTGGNTLSANLKNILPQVDRIDALVGYFYFSGFKDLYKELENKKIRILVGMDIDKSIIDKISTLQNVNLDTYLVDSKITSRSAVKDEYIQNFSKVFNDSEEFDTEESKAAFEVFLNKISDGSLEIKKTPTPNHSKFYILHGEEKLVIMGSSNLTYQGLKGQEEHNIVLKEDHYYASHNSRFETLWTNPENITLVDISTAEGFIKKIKSSVWLYQLPDPQLMYYRVLSEYFSLTEETENKTPNKITGGKFTDLMYQKDAINIGIDRIKKFGGVIIADVVGLGKSIIASSIAHNLELQTIIIAPPHLENQWNDYKAEFDFKGFVYSTGKIEEALKRHENSDKKMLIILDEAHKHRNEDTENYKKLHRLCVNQYVMCLSATPFNNDPKDIYALIKLFSTPGQSTIRTVENLSISFHNLFKRYKTIRRQLRKEKTSEDEIKIKKELHDIALDLRKMIEPLVIRRSRLDLEEIQDYKEDLIKQKVAFAKVKDPELLEYDLGETFDIYTSTLNRISPNDKSKGFIGVRYTPLKYLNEGSNFYQKFEDNENDDSGENKVQNITQAQVNVAKFMRRLLVRRFESSRGAFLISLDNMITSSEKMLSWYIERNEVPIFKKGVLPGVEDLEEMDDEELAFEIEKLERSGLIIVPGSEIKKEFKIDLEKDIALLKDIKSKWLEIKNDPKLDYLENRLNTIIKENPKRKIVLFTEFSDTADYISSVLIKNGNKRIFKYSSADASPENKNIIRVNFDAGLDESKQSNDFDIIIATDAISEGFNLHRAGAIINYDIPYNPTRVIQRVGRINRINKKMFEELYIYNFFPTATGDDEIKTKAISTLKMDLIHNLLGEDTKILTDSENLKNYFADQYKEKNNESEQLSWDAKFRNEWLKIKSDKDLMQKVFAIPHRSRIGRIVEGQKGVVAFAKKNGNYIFAYGNSAENVSIVPPQVAMPLFDEVKTGEISHETSAGFESIYKLAKEHIFRNNTKANIENGRRKDALLKVQVLGEKYSEAKDYCEDLKKIIKDLDALPNGLLLEIANLKNIGSNPGEAFEELKTLVPENYLQNIFKTAELGEDTSKLIVLSEEFI